MSINDVTAKNYEETVVLSPVPVVINLWAKWCEAPCMMVEKVLGEINEEYGQYLRIVKMSLDTQPELREMLEINQVPMTIMMTGGVVCKKIPGIPSKEEMMEALEVETIKDFADRGITYHPKRNYIPEYIRDERW